jgi:hypothetical protein
MRSFIASNPPFDPRAVSARSEQLTISDILSRAITGRQTKTSAVPRLRISSEARSAPIKFVPVSNNNAIAIE